MTTRLLTNSPVPDYPDADDERWWREAVGDMLMGFTFRSRANIRIGNQIVVIDASGRDELLEIRRLALLGASK